MLGQRRRRWPNIKPSLDHTLLFAGTLTAVNGEVDWINCPPFYGSATRVCEVGAIVVDLVIPLAGFVRRCTLPYKAEIKYLLPYRVSRYCLLALHDSTGYS